MVNTHGDDPVSEEAPAKHVPAAAVIRVEQALFGIIGHKGHVGGVSCLR